ncbi:hypothetical protein DUI87_08670 [Hirundo rustica rustica]|uniref:VWFC domain-containing protein n=1 Tax=Hirundo rustica rustica TaxID=333673 RepID=A0A3M0KQI8_HIRRU|nr:hypothetical protein DUI87_08670 [Hirundo rustica rustica]
MGAPSAAGATLGLLPLLLSAALAAADAASGACVYHGLLFENNTFWKPDSCQDCRCRSGVVTCEPTVCKAPQCDFQKGEVLQIASNKCCPECASRAEGFCQHEGQIHSEEVMVLSPGKCCPECVPKPCSVSGRTFQGEKKVQRPGKCCEECASSQGSCLDGGAVRYHGEMWNSTRCDFCVCQEGKVTCQGAECAKVECAKLFERAACVLLAVNWIIYTNDDGVLSWLSGED